MTRSRIAVAILLASMLFVAGCGGVEIQASLIYQVNRPAPAEGGTGEVLLARPAEPQDALKLPSGKLLIGTTKPSGREIVTADRIGDWVTLALKEELEQAGYRVTTVPEIPRGVEKALKIGVPDLSVVQEDNLVTLKTIAVVRVEIEVWRGGANVKTLSVESSAEEIGVDRSSGPVSGALLQALQGATRKLMPDLVKQLEGQQR